MPVSPSVTFHDGRSIPQLGYGVWQVENDIAADVVVKALEAGYRHVDTARGYNNEAGVGRALKAAGLERDDVFVTSKVPNQDQGRDKTLASFDATMADLGLDELDLYLIHWPAPSKGLAVETWKALVELQEQGRIRSIGVSNFRIEDLEKLEAETGVLPVLNQIELHPYFNQPELREFHASKNIVTESWSPLGQGGGELVDPVVPKIAETHGASPAQVVIAWNLALGNVVIPKSVTPERIISNFASLEVELSDDEIAQIHRPAQGRGRPSGRQPERHGRAPGRLTAGRRRRPVVDHRSVSVPRPLSRLMSGSAPPAAAGEAGPVVHRASSVPSGRPGSPGPPARLARAARPARRTRPTRAARRTPPARPAWLGPALLGSAGRLHVIPRNVVGSGARSRITVGGSP